MLTELSLTVSWTTEAFTGSSCIQAKSIDESNKTGKRVNTNDPSKGNLVGINFAGNGQNDLRPKLHQSSGIVFIQKLMIFEFKEKKVFDAFSVSGFREALGENADGKQLDR